MGKRRPTAAPPCAYRAAGQLEPAAALEPAIAAYPAWIPAAILQNQVDHRQPYDGDQGVQFEPVGPLAAQAIVKIFPK